MSSMYQAIHQLADSRAEEAAAVLNGCKQPGGVGHVDGLHLSPDAMPHLVESLEPFLEDVAAVFSDSSLCSVCDVGGNFDLDRRGQAAAAALGAVPLQRGYNVADKGYEEKNGYDDDWLWYHCDWGPRWCPRPQSGLEPNVALRSSLLSSSSKVLRWAESLLIFAEVDASQADDRCQAGILLALPGRWPRALSLLSGPYLHSRATAAAAGTCQDSWGRCLVLLGDLASRGGRDFAATTTAAIAALDKEGNWETASGLLRLAEQVDEVMCTAVLSSARQMPVSVHQPGTATQANAGGNS
ncbi:tatB [Symbiodinium sp. KB8]|nr:tatB [Symbiodinium sp. KB8]